MLVTSNSKEEVAGLFFDDNVALCALLDMSSKGVLRIKNAAALAMPGGVDKTEKAKYLEELWKLSKIKTSSVTVSIHSRSTVVKSFSMEGLSDADVTRALLLESEDLFQLSDDDMALDWHAIQREQSRLDGIYVAVPRLVLNDELTTAKHAGLYPVIVDTIPLALANLYFAMQMPAEEAVFIVHVRESAWDLVVIYGNGLTYCRSVGNTGPDENNNFSILSKAVREVCDYSKHKLRQAPIMNICLTGFMDNPNGYAMALQDELQLMVDVWDPFGELCDASSHIHIPNKLYGSTTVFSVALGLALRRD